MIVVWTGVMAKEGERFFRWNWQDFLLNKKLVVKKKKKRVIRNYTIVFLHCRFLQNI